MRLYLIRHGQSTNNALADVRQRVYDPPLTALGQQQAEALAEYLVMPGEIPVGIHTLSDETAQPFHFDHLYTSAMTRALQTTRPVAAALRIQPEIWLDIHEAGGVFLTHDERGNQGYPGITRSQIVADFPGYVIPEGVTEAGWWDVQQGEETREAFTLRVVRVAHAIRRRASDKKTAAEHIALVSHGLFLSALVKILMGHSIWQPTAPFFAHYNAAITRLDFNEGWDDPVRLHYLNRVEHLRLGLRSW